MVSPGKTSQKNSSKELSINNDLERLNKKESDTNRVLQNEDIKIYNSKKRKKYASK